MTDKDIKNMTFESLVELVLQLQRENQLLKEEISELKSQLKTNSNNSSKPPSSDGYSKKPALPRDKKGKKGGQKGHAGRTLHKVSKPDHIDDCSNKQCTCGCELSHINGEIIETRQVFDLPDPRLEVTEYQIRQKKCPECGRNNTGEFPENINAPVQYGNNVKSLLVLLNNDYKIPFNKIQSLFNDLFGYPINESTIVKANKLCYNKLESTEDLIKSKVIDSIVAHSDETGMRVEGKLHWLHAATTILFTYLFVHKKRGKEALLSEKSIITKITNWLVHDCWSSYFNFTKAKHALCGAHLLREFQGLIERNCKWAGTFKTYLLNVYNMPINERLSKRQILEKRFDHLCNIADKIEPPPQKSKGRGKKKRTKGRNLLKRLQKHKNAVLAFAFNESVPFTNNQAERDVRPAKIKLKMATSFRTIKGAEIYSRIQGFISTSRKHQLNIFKELSNTFNGNNFILQNYSTTK